MLKEKLQKLKRVLGVPDPETKIDDVAEESTNDIELTEISEIIPTKEEKEEMDIEIDEGYLQYSAEVVGFENREMQWNSYRTIMSYTDSNDILDFGCGRGDLYSFLKTEDPGEVYTYTGIDMNEPLIKAGNEAHEGINLIHTDWFQLPEKVEADWVVNAGSCNLRYDADLTKDDLTYTQDTIKNMFQHCKKGIILLLASTFTETDDGLVNHNPGELFNWAQEEFGNVAIDHSVGKDVFSLIIYKV